MKWKKILTVSINVVIVIYLLLAVTAFSKSADKERVCTDVEVTIDRGVIAGFLTPASVRQMLIEQKLSPIGRRMSDVNLRTIEERLQAQQLIDNAECYKTPSGKVCIRISERVPVIRVMASNGDDYYVDKEGKTLQNTGYTCNLIVATGCIDRNYAARVLAPIGRIVVADDFWRNQIVQINVLADSTVEMVPRVGNHILYLGRPVGVTKKLERLQKFYKYGLSQAGWNKYSRISVEYSNQIVCKKRTSGNTNKQVVSKPQDIVPADSKPQNSDSVKTKPVETKPADSKPATAKPAESKPATAKPVVKNTTGNKPVTNKTSDKKQPTVKAAAVKSVEKKPATGKAANVKTANNKKK